MPFRTNAILSISLVDVLAPAGNSLGGRQFGTKSAQLVSFSVFKIGLKRQSNRGVMSEHFCF